VHHVTAVPAEGTVAVLESRTPAHADSAAGAAVAAR
jgi:hypothetical protein